MARGIQRGGGRLPEHPVGPVLVALAALVLHHVALNVQLLKGHRLEQTTHPIGLQPERQLEGVRGDDLVVVRAIGVGGSVVHRPGGLQEVVEVALGNVRAPLEHDVLEQVGEAGATGLLVAGSHVVPHVHRRDRDRVVLVHDDAQAVVELVELVGDSDLLRRGGKRLEEEEEDEAFQHGRTG